MYILSALEKESFRTLAVIELVVSALTSPGWEPSTAEPLTGVWGIVDGVVAKDETPDEKLLLGWRRRFLAANSAASLIEIAEAFFFLNENLGLGAA
jgi:hypothetical protein